MKTPHASADESWMDEALIWAKRARELGEVPVGAVLVQGDRLLAGAGNGPIGNTDPTAHAEIEVLRAGARAIGNYRLTGTTLYVSLEPCVMCLGAIMHARVARLVYGAPDPRFGALERLDPGRIGWVFNHDLVITSGIRSQEAILLLRGFFADRRLRETGAP
ncbi:MAG: tRNA adenosine(34) deaminase TadA [Gammaproteobacteria bacterium]